MKAVRAWSVIVLLSVGAPALQASTHETALEAVTVESEGASVAVDLRTSAPPGQPRAQWLDAPTRLLLDLADTRLTWTAGRLAGSGDLVKEVRATQVRPGVARVVIETSQKAPYRVDQRPGGQGLRILFGAGEGDRAPAPTVQPQPPATPSPANPRRSQPAGPRLYGVVHGNRGWVAFIEDPDSKRVKPYVVGQSVGSAVVERIEAEAVTLKGPLGSVRLRLRGEPGQVDARPR